MKSSGHSKIPLYALRIGEWVLAIGTVWYLATNVSERILPGGLPEDSGVWMWHHAPIALPAIFIWITGIISNVTANRDGLSRQRRFGLLMLLLFGVMLFFSFGPTKSYHDEANVLGFYVPLSLFAAAVYFWIGWTQDCESRIRDEWLERLIRRYFGKR